MTTEQWIIIAVLLVFLFAAGVTGQYLEWREHNQVRSLPWHEIPKPRGTVIAYIVERQGAISLNIIDDAGCGYHYGSKAGEPARVLDDFGSAFHSFPVSRVVLLRLAKESTAVLSPTLDNTRP